MTGYEVILGPVSGNLRAAGSEVTGGSVGGYAPVTGENVTLAGLIAGDMVILAEDIIFRPAAKIMGNLTIYAEDPSGIEVPETVAPNARVTIKEMEHYVEGDTPGTMAMRRSIWQIATGFLLGVLISGLIWSGFLVTSALAGSGFVLMLTIIGVFLLPVMLIVPMVAIFAGYVLGSYVLGVGIWLAMGRAMPDRLPGKFLLACLGALVAGLAWLVPVAGWVFVLGLTMLGIGTLAAFAWPGGWLLRRDAVRP